MTKKISFVAGMVLVHALQAQWLKYPVAGVPRLANGQPNLVAPAPKTPDGKPDLSGFWDAEKPTGNGVSFAGEPLPPLFTNIGARLESGLPFTAWARDVLKSRLADNAKDSPDARCMPLGIVWLHSHLSPRKIVQTPSLIVILYERFTQFRQIFTDGRPLPADPEPLFFGYSSAKWEGDVLVVQSLGFRDDMWADLSGSPITSAAKITERFRRPNYGHLEIEITVDDPKAYSSPWTVKVNQTLQVEGDLLELICEDIEKSRAHLVGK